jgi:hypothetical protein
MPATFADIHGTFQDLFEFLDPALTSGFDFDDYAKGEETIMRPALERLGFNVGKFRSLEKDSFGPLSRGVFCIGPDGERVTFCYG